MSNLKYFVRDCSFILVQTRSKNRGNQRVSQNEDYTLRKYYIFIKFKVSPLAFVCSISAVQILE